MKRRNWWDHIDPHVIVGAYPFSRDVAAMHAAGVRAVVNTCEEYKGPHVEYMRLGIEQLQIPTTDFTHPRLQDVQMAVEFVQQHVQRGEIVYIHCKAGRARSATVAICWLMKYRSMSAQEAQKTLLESRPHINPRLTQRAVVQAFAESLRESPGGNDARRENDLGSNDLTDHRKLTETTSPRSTWAKFAVLAIVIGIAVAVYLQFADTLTLQSLANRETQLREFRDQHPVLVYAIAFAIYVTVTGLSLPGAAVLSLVTAWFFGFWRGLILVSFASTTGATIAFLLSRYLLRDTIQNRFGDRLSKFNDNLQREGAFYLFTLRLIVGVPFFVINVVMGLTPIKTQTFWWVSQLGMLPGTAAYVYAGASVPDLNTLAETGASGIFSLQLIVAFAILGIFPLIAKRLVNRFRS